MPGPPPSAAGSWLFHLYIIQASDQISLMFTVDIHIKQIAPAQCSCSVAVHLMRSGYRCFKCCSYGCQPLGCLAPSPFIYVIYSPP